MASRSRTADSNDRTGAGNDICIVGVFGRGLVFWVKMKIEIGAVAETRGLNDLALQLEHRNTGAIENDSFGLFRVLELIENGRRHSTWGVSQLRGGAELAMRRELRRGNHPNHLQVRSEYGDGVK
jgi:hypothetical protein